MTDLNLITVSEFKALMPALDVSRFDDPTISGMIAAGSKQVSDYLEYSPLAENITNEIRNGIITTEGDLLIFVNKPPIQSVSNVALTRGTVTVTLQITDPSTGVNRYNIDYLLRTIRYPYEQMTLAGSPIMTNFLSLRGSSFYTSINYRGGFEAGALPQTIKLAACLFASDLFSTQFNPIGATSLKQGGLGYSFENRNLKNGETLNTHRAKQLLGPYRRMG